MMLEKLRMLCEGAIMVALAQALSYLKLWQMPQGGSVTLNMLPIFIYCARWGFAPGMLASFALGVLQLIFDGAYAWSWQSMVGDYLLAYGFMGFAGLMARENIALGTVLGGIARFLVHWVVGATLWAEYMPERFFGMTMVSPWVYSALYNGSFIMVDLILILIIECVLHKIIPAQLRYQRS